MAELGIAFDSGTVEPGGTYDPLPTGDYMAAVTGTEVKDNKAGTGKLVAVTLEVVDGPHRGRRLWDYINFKHSNLTAQEIGQRQLSALCRACGVTTLTDTSQFHGKVVKVKVGQDKGQLGDLRNVVKGYDWKASQAPAAASARAEIDDDSIPF